MTHIPQPHNDPSTPTGRGLLADVMATISDPSPAAPDQPSPAAPAAPTPAAATPATVEPGPGPVPYDRFKEVNDRARAAQDEVAQLRAWKEEQEQAKLTEIERAQQTAQTAEQRATTAETRADLAERRFDVWKAAHAAGFEDPEDAVVYLKDQFGDLDSTDKITAAVNTLAEAKPKLIGSGAPSRPAPIGGLTPPSAPNSDVPLGPDGKPDEKAGLGRDLLAALTGRKAT